MMCEQCMEDGLADWGCRAHVNHAWVMGVITMPSCAARQAQPLIKPSIHAEQPQQGMRES